MHEFSLASDIIDIASQSAKANGCNQVTKVILRIGQLAGVEEPALDTALEALTPGTILSEAVFEKVHIDGKARCLDCNTEFGITDFFSLCPNCQSFSKDILAGKEFDIVSIDAE